MPADFFVLRSIFRSRALFPVYLTALLTACGGENGGHPGSSSGSSTSSGSGSSSGTSSGASSSSSGSATTSSSSSGMAAGGCLQPALDSGYCLVWQDEFSGTALDTSKWSAEVNCWGGGNNEAQCYVDRPENLWVDGGYLHLKAIREDVTGPSVVDDEPGYFREDSSGTGTYSSARVRTKNQGDWRYGRFEIRAKLPSGQGTWPAVWMLPTDNVYGGWASSGEIDIMEAVNLKVDGERRLYGTLHFGDNWPNNVHSGDSYQLPNAVSPADDFHEYAIEWEEGEIRWYVDGDHFATQTQDGWYTMADLDDPAAPFNQRFHLLLNLAVGGDWAAAVNDTGIDASVFPQEMVVDYVRVYECTRDPETGRGCASRNVNVAVNPGVAPPAPVDTAGDALTIFDGATTNVAFNWGVYTESGEIGYQIVNAGEPYGEVAELTFSTDTGIGFFQSGTTFDLSEFSRISFALRVVEDPRPVKAPLLFRADCGYPCTSGDVVLVYPGLNVWTHYEIPLRELAAGGLAINAVDTPFVISTSVGNQAGLKLMLDNLVIHRY